MLAVCLCDLLGFMLWLVGLLLLVCWVCLVLGAGCWWFLFWFVGLYWFVGLAKGVVLLTCLLGCVMLYLVVVRFVYCVGLWVLICVICCDLLGGSGNYCSYELADVA